MLNGDLTVVLSVASEGSGLVSTTSVTKAVSYELLAAFLILSQVLPNLPTVTSFRLFCLAQLIKAGVRVCTVLA